MEDNRGPKQMTKNVGTTIVKGPPDPDIFFGGGGGRFEIVNSRSQLSPQIKKTNQDHSTTIKRIKKKEKTNASQNIIARIYNCN